MKLCQPQREALVALFSADFKLSLVLRSCCFDIKTDGLLLASDVTPPRLEGKRLLLRLQIFSFSALLPHAEFLL